jgi:hypothetical protein
MLLLLAVLQHEGIEPPADRAYLSGPCLCLVCVLPAKPSSNRTVANKLACSPVAGRDHDAEEPGAESGDGTVH